MNSVNKIPFFALVLSLVICFPAKAGELTFYDDATAKYPTPQNFREFAINNMVDHRNNIVNRKDLTALEKNQLASDLGTLILHEKANDDKLSLVSRSAHNVEKLIGLAGYDKAKDIMENKLTPSMVNNFPKTVKVLKPKGLNDEFLEIISSLVSKAIDSLKELSKNQK